MSLLLLALAAGAIIAIFILMLKGALKEFLPAEAGVALDRGFDRVAWLLKKVTAAILLTLVGFFIWLFYFSSYGRESAPPATPVAADGLPAPAIKISAAPDPRHCAKDDAKCFKVWFHDYEAGILAQFKAYRAYEDTAEKAWKNSDSATAGRVRDVMLVSAPDAAEWNMATPEAITVIGIKKVDAAWDCRFAILKLNWVLGQTSIGKFEDAVQDRIDYIKSARACEKAFHIAPIKSALRRDIDNR